MRMALLDLTGSTFKPVSLRRKAFASHLILALLSQHTLLPSPLTPTLLSVAITISYKMLCNPSQCRPAANVVQYSCCSFNCSLPSLRTGIAVSEIIYFKWKDDCRVYLQDIGVFPLSSGGNHDIMDRSTIEDQLPSSYGPIEEEGKLSNS